MAFADASAVVSADFSRFQREFGPGLRAAVNKALPAVIRVFRNAGRTAADAFVDGFASRIERLVPAARRAGTAAGLAFERAAEARTKDIDVAFKIPEARAVALGKQFRAGIAKQVQAIPVSFASKPSARAIGQLTGRRFRAGAMEFTTNIPVTFQVDRVEQQGTRIGRRFRTAAERETADINARITTSGNAQLTGFFSTLARLAGGAASAVLNLRVALVLLGAVSLVPLLALVANLAPLVGILAALPALLVTAVAGFSVLGASMARVGELIQSRFLPAFAGLREQIARVATRGLGDQLEILGKTLDGAVTRGSLRAAGALNTLFINLTKVGQQRATVTGIGAIFDTVTLAIGRLGTSLPGLLAGLRDIAVAVLPALNEMSGTLARLITQFGTFLTDAAKSGAALDWVNAARATFATLGDILINVGSIFKSVFAAAGSVGGDVLGTLRDLTGVIADFAASAQGMQVFETIFSTLKEVTTALTPVFRAVLDVVASVLSTALPLLLPLLKVVADLATTLITALGPVLLSLAPLLEGLVTGLVGFLAPLGPVIEQVARVFVEVIGPLSTFLGDFFAQVGPLLGEFVAALATSLMPILQALVPIVISFLGQIQPLIPAIIDLIPAVTQVTIALAPLVTLFAQILVTLFQVQAPLIKLLSTFIAFLTSKAIVPILQLQAKALEKLRGPIEAIIGPLREFGNFVSNLSVGDIGTMISDTFNRALEVVSGFIGRVGAFFQALPGQIGGFLSSLPGKLAGAFTAAINFTFEAIGAAIGLLITNFFTLPGRIVAAVSSLGEMLGTFFSDLWKSITDGASNKWNEFIAFLTPIPGRILSAFFNLPTTLGNFFTNLWNKIKSITSTGVNSVVGFVQSIPARIAQFGVSLFNAGKSLIGKLLDGLVSLGSRGLGFVQQIGRALKRFINDNVIGALERGLNSSLPFDIKLPRLAKGAFVTEPTVALIAEKGPEVVLPLNNPARARDLAAESGVDRIIGSTSSPNFNITVLLGPNQIMDILRVEIDDAMDVQGRQISYGTRGVV